MIDSVQVSTGRITTWFTWRERLRILLGQSVGIEVQRVTTGTQMQTCYTIYVGEEEIFSHASEPCPASQVEGTPLLLWCSIIGLWE